MAEERVQRRLAAILFADVAGYSAMMGRDEEGAIAGFKRCLEALAPIIAMHGGRVVKTMGDGLLVEYTSVVEAVVSAQAMQRRIAVRNRDLPEDQTMRFRMGIHVGDIVVDGDDILGDGVNIAARLEGQAAPGGVVVSGRVHEEVAGKLDLTFDDLGPRELKNIARPVHLYALAPEGAPAPPPTPELPDKPSIVVLPFDDMSGDSGDPYFADGITEDIITELSRFSSLFVIGRKSTFTYRGRAVKAQEIRRDLGVRYIVEGSVRRAGDRVRVTVQLIESETGNQVWADRYDRELGDIFDLQDELTHAIVAAIPGRLESADLNRIKR
ncbi:MAG: adenylate/guanylate cyclase domain-containing protein, partial [Alphaproteobacteria bacterium]|nr:adenylate/guanylate cyclase domain-containing protein [Alphaproteobacteria bacterium]